MRAISAGILLSLALLVALLAGSAEGAEKKKKKKSGAVRGSVTTVERGKDGAGTITLQTKGKKGEAGKSVKIDITKDTKFTKAGKKKQGIPASPSNFEAAEQGQQVRVRLLSGSTSVADDVLIVGKKKKKNT